MWLIDPSVTRIAPRLAAAGHEASLLHDAFFPTPGYPMNGAAARPVVFLFPGLTSDLAELSALTIGCGNALTAVPIGYPH